MNLCSYPVIDLKATGQNIRDLRIEKGFSIEDFQDYFKFNDPRSIYKWQAGKCLPSIDNLYALSVLLEVPMDRIIVSIRQQNNPSEPQDKACGSVAFEPVAICASEPTVHSIYPKFMVVLSHSIEGGNCEWKMPTCSTWTAPPWEWTAQRLVA